ncbi:transketolase [Anaerobacterium chartisolvens]|uniref:Transketolase n=1 Tax=Anaerobacterium chartisolvens TaxID=1297424 RepID=A0A369BCX6_9FIRM|nr:transketolase [Anaerobacterium chartisolvens]RCX17524.1 transketolase [Anaerobacterium chartisolvens]
MNSVVNDLEKRAKEIRLNIVKMIGPGKTGHFGGSCSAADIVTALYFWKMRHDPKNPKWSERDRLILSKGHAAIVQYAALAMCGYFPEEELYGLKKLGSMLQGHPDLRKIAGIEANTGSLGQGLSISCGIAAGAKIDGMGYKVYCIVGDGELAEGQIWEAAMAAAHYRLDNLTGIIDCNKLQATGAIKERFDTFPMKEKWEAFGWNTIEIDGHDMEQIMDGLSCADKVKGKPTMIIAHTVKGKGIEIAENNAAFHNGMLTKEQYELACGALMD